MRRPGSFEERLSDDFLFSAPPDPMLDRDGFFERCWPGAGRGQDFEFVRLIEAGDEVVVIYRATSPETAGGGTPRISPMRTRSFVFEVYFGWNLEWWLLDVAQSGSDRLRSSRSNTDAQPRAVGRTKTMETLLVFHEVDDVDHWLASPRREELFAPLGITVRTFRDPAGSNRVGGIVEVPDISTFEQALQSDAAAEGMKFDGVRPETILVLAEA